MVIEAIQYTLSNCAAIHEWLGLQHIVYEGEPCGVGNFLIETLEGTMSAQPGDYIIKGIHGEFYPCKPDIFNQSYEEVFQLENSDDFLMEDYNTFTRPYRG